MDIPDGRITKSYDCHTCGSIYKVSPAGIEMLVPAGSFTASVSPVKIVSNLVL